MALKFLYTPQYQEFNPPLEWEDMAVEATINESNFRANISTTVFTFVGDIAEYIKDEWIPNYGVHNGVPLRIVIDNQEIIFDGFLKLSEYDIYSKLGPIIYKIPIVDLTDNLTSLDRISIFSQSLLFKQGFINPTMFYHMPIVKVSKKSAQDRIAALTNLAFTVISTFFQMIQDFFSAISDMIGVSVLIGVVEFATLAINLYIQVNQLVDLIVEMKDQLLPSQTYKNCMKLKDIVEAAFAKINKTVDWGIIEDEIDHHFLVASNYGTDGTIQPLNSPPGILNISDWGYLMDELMQEVEKLFYTRFDDRGDEVWIKTKKDPDWLQQSGYEPTDLVIEQTKQYQNGYYRNKTEELKATEIFQYEIDSSDAWTLTEKNGDSHEVHRELINELNPRMNTLKGLKDTKVNWAMGVRWDSVDFLLDLLNDLIGEFNINLDLVQGYLTQYQQYIDPGSNSSQSQADIMALNQINFFFAISPGGLKVEDNTWAIPKIVWANSIISDEGQDTKVLNIPSNFKDKLSAEYKYEEYYTYDSPAEEYNFQGQYTEVLDYRIDFGKEDYLLVKQNPYFDMDSLESNFTFIEWLIEGYSANVNIDRREIYDTNIKEIVV